MVSMNPTGPRDLSIVKLLEIAATVKDIGVPMPGVDALGTGVLSNGHLGADVLWVPAGSRFPVHTHPGDHLLYCISGSGTITVAEHTYEVVPGDFYLVNGLEPHAVGAAADEAHVLLSIGAPHKPVHLPDRMQLTDWDASPSAAPIYVNRSE